MLKLVPKLKPIKVDPGKLLLDPNNPRFVTSHDDHVAYDRIADPAEIDRTARRMFPGGKEDEFRIEELVNSILRNGWQSIDSIFVRLYKDTDYYVVLEGNRRVTAIREILRRPDTPKSLRDSLSSIEVMEIQGNHSDDEFEQQVSYLLGVRHHGALKRWSPFAQARNILKTYVEYAGYTTEGDFRWDENIARKVATALSISLDQVSERLRVYCAMVSVASLPEVGPSRLRDHYYSLFKELLARRKGRLGKYIEQDPDTLVLPPDSAKRMDSLCHFSIDGRKGSPIANPQEWRSLEKILVDEDETKRLANMSRIEDGKEAPSIVWAQRSQELKKLEWSRWLEKVSVVLAKVPLGDIDLENPDTVQLVKRLATHVDELQAQVQPGA